MPDTRPLGDSLTSGQYDDPPASAEPSSTPRTRRSRLQQALRATADMAASDLAEMGAPAHPPQSPPRPVLWSRRRRQRSPSSSDPRDTGSGEEVRRHGPKRRRLDSEAVPCMRLPIRYGHYGQVEAGRLKLQIISCDGGDHRDPRHPGTYLGPQNLLRHDKSVYCSERPTSGIVLKHADDTPFCLEKLHIVGPEHGFTAPIREGLVYVAMSLNDLSKYMDRLRHRHGRTHGVHTPPCRRRSSFRSSPEQMTLSDALRDPVISAAYDARERDSARHSDASGGGRPYGNEADHGVYNYEVEPHDDNITISDSPESGLTADESSLPVALLSDEEPGPEESSSQEVLDFRLQRLRNMRRRFDLDNWDRDGRWSRLGESQEVHERDRDGSWGLRHLDAMMARSRMADFPQREDSTDDRDRDPRHHSHPSSSSYYPATKYKPAGPEPHDNSLDDPNVTRARFHIRQGKYKVAIKFDPPVSGRFILLKLWANQSNVDVQSVIAKGYGCARFFPAVEFR